jgi:hypothetical protein
MTATHDDSPDHEIIENPWEYRIVRLDYQRDPDKPCDAFLDLTFSKAESVRRLRFLRPKNLLIGEGFPDHTAGLVILDISNRQLEGLRVEVANFENSPGITFYAAEVLDLDATT